MGFSEKWENAPPSLKWGIAALVFGFLFLYIPIGMIWVHAIDDNLDFDAGDFKIKGGSSTVSIAEALIHRETKTHHWTSSDPFWMPGAWLDRMPAYQRGIMSGISRFAIQMKDEIGRTRGSSQVDPDLEKAAGLLQYSPHVWLFDFSVSILPTASSEKQYRGGMKALQQYNARLARGEAVFERRADNLMETLDRLAADMGSSSAALSNHIEQYSGTLIDTDADELYYYTKGRMYVYYLLMRELGKDFADVLREKQLQSAWTQTLASLHEGAGLNNFFVFNAKPDSQFLPNHLGNQGFYLIRARTQLREITNILLK